jgi:hypothetical protein
MHVQCFTRLFYSVRKPLLALLMAPALCPANSSFAQSPGGADEQATEAVRAWYRVVDDGSDQAHLLAFGTVGSASEPLHEAYLQLSRRLRIQMSEAQFFAHYRGLANLKLLQAHAANVGDGPLRVFVEEERIAVLAGVPAMAWFAGFVEMTQTSEGWKISSFKDVKPEDIISMPLGGHQPWRANPEDVARVGLKCFSNEPDCTVVSNSLSSNGHSLDQASTSERPVIVMIRTAAGLRRVELARLHSGEWVVVKGQTIAGF